MRFRSFVALATAVLTANSAAHAQTSIVQGYTLSAAQPVAALTFDVTSGGTFSLYTQGPTIDPVIFLYSAAGVGSGSFLARNDDGCAVAICGPSGSWANGIITTMLNPGTYTIYGAFCCTSQSELEAGTAAFGYTVDGAATAPLNLVVSSEQGIANAASSVVPEPSTYALMATGLAGLGLVARRRRAV